MRRRANPSLWLLLACAIAATAGVSASLEQQTLPPFRGGTNLVLVDVYPQKDGAFVEGLTADDLEVFEDGQRQRIDQFEFVRLDSGQAQQRQPDPANLAEMRVLAADPHNRVFIAFLDQGHTTLEGSNRIRRPLVETLDRLMAPNDLFGVMLPRLRPSDVTLSRLLGSTDEQLEKYWVWGERQRLTSYSDPVEQTLRECYRTKSSGDPWLYRDDGVMRYLDEVLIDRRREDRTLTSLEDLAAYVGSWRDARTVIVLVSDGWRLFGRDRALDKEIAAHPSFGTIPMATPGNPQIPLPGSVTVNGRGQQNECVAEAIRLSNLDNQRRLQDLMTSANRFNVSIYPVAAGGLAAFDSHLGEMASHGTDERVTFSDLAHMRKRVESLRTVAEGTDGIAIVNTNDLAAGMRRVVTDVSSYYLLGYVSTDQRQDTRFRRIQVRAKTPGLNIRARRGYVASVRNARPAPEPAGGAVGGADAAEITAALGSLTARRPSAELFLAGHEHGGTLTIVTELSLQALESPEWQRGASVTAEISTEAGAPVATVTATVDPAARAASIQTPVTGTGPWRVTVKASGVRTTTQDSIRVTSRAAGIFGPALLFRAATPPRAPLRPVVQPTFSRNERLRVEVPVREAEARLGPRARLLDRRGQPLALAPTVAIADRAGASVATVDLTLTPLAEGEYLIEVTAGDAAGGGRALVAFRVVR